MADNFEGAVGKIIEIVSSASIELEASAGALSATADRSQVLTTTMATASELASSNVQSVAVSSSVNQIAVEFKIRREWQMRRSSKLAYY